MQPLSVKKSVFVVWNPCIILCPFRNFSIRGFWGFFFSFPFLFICYYLIIFIVSLLQLPQFFPLCSLLPIPPPRSLVPQSTPTLWAMSVGHSYISLPIPFLFFSTLITLSPLLWSLLVLVQCPRTNPLPILKVDCS